MADLVRQNAHQRIVAQVLLRCGFHQVIGHDDRSPGQGESVGAQAGAERQRQARRVAAIALQARLELARQCVEAFAQLRLAGCRAACWV